jgi:diguanylate cyclase (GGDEF)-like protein
MRRLPIAKPKKTPLERLERLNDRLRELNRSMEKLVHPTQEQDPGPTWRWIEIPGGGAALLGEHGEVLLKAEWMPKPNVALAIAAAPDLRKEKFGILFDRRFLKTDIPEQLAWAEGTIHALLFLDFDGMKAINDRLGHDVGDELLQSYFTSVAFLVKDIGEAYSFGGDEVVVLLPDHDQPRAEVVRDEIEATVVKKCGLDPRIAAAGIAVGVSGGIHVFDEETETLDEVIKKADTAMYEIKNARKAARSAPTA